VTSDIGPLFGDEVLTVAVDQNPARGAGSEGVDAVRFRPDVVGGLLRLTQPAIGRGRNPLRDEFVSGGRGADDLRRDLVATMARLGFELDYRENLGPWMGLERFDDVAMVFRS